MGDPYDVLGVKKDATLPEIKSAYKNLAKKLHPDKTGANPRALEQMKLVNEAYASLCSNLQRGSSMTEDEMKYNEEVWKSYSKQVEDYYNQVQQYMEAQMKVIRSEKEKLDIYEKQIRSRELELDGNMKDLENQKARYGSLLSKEKELKRREEYIEKRENELDELMLCISRSNSIVVDLVQASKALRNRKG